MDEYETAVTSGSHGSTGGMVGTRASYTLIGANSRTATSYEFGFEVNFPSTSSYYKEKKNAGNGNTSNRWLTFLTDSEEESKAWIIAIMQESEIR